MSVEGRSPLFKSLFRDSFKNLLPRFRQEKELGAIALLVGLWLLSVGLDWVWLALDQSVPSWDPADHLIGALNYRWMLLHADWFSGEWWRGIWTLSSKYPPLVYLSTAPSLTLFGLSADAATTVNAFYSAVLLGSVYIIGRHLFSPSVGLWGVGLCLLFPQFYTLRSQYFMDYPLAAGVAAAFALLTLWKDAKSRRAQWIWAIAFGITFGLALLIKQTGLIFLAVPLCWVAIAALIRRRWARILQLLSGLVITALMLVPWSRTNWLFQISAAFSANTRSAEIEGDPEIFSWAGLSYYATHLPQAVSYPILIVGLSGLLLWAVGTLWRSPDSLPQLRSLHTWVQRHQPSLPPQWWRGLGWLGIFCGGAYLVWSSFANKDVRYIMPYLPGVAIALAVGIACWKGRWRTVPWGIVGLSLLLMFTNLLPLGGGDRPPALSRLLTPAAQHRPYLGERFPHAEIVDELVQAQPYQIVNLGVLPSTPDINQHNLNFFGTVRDFQVYARRMGKSQDHIDQDLRSMDWFVSVSRPQLNAHDRKSRQRQIEITRMLRRSPDFQRQNRWTLPDGSSLDLFRRRVLPVTVEPLADLPANLSNREPVQLANVTVPAQAPAGQPIPVTYTWLGDWTALSQGDVILTWQLASDALDAENSEAPVSSDLEPNSETPSGSDSGANFESDSNSHWLHDHSIGLGTLRPQPIQANQSMLAPDPDLDAPAFRIIERTAMLPPADAPAGTYRLKAIYRNRVTGKTWAIAPPPIQLSLDPAAEPVMAPEVDRASQLRLLSQALPDGLDALDPVFDQIGRFSLYDPVQSYAVQVENTLSYRLQQDPTNLDYAYGLVLAQVLQRDAEGAIATLNHLTQIDADNPFAHAYLAFVNLYALRPRSAQQAIQPALEINPESPEFRGLNAAAALLQGNLWRAWKDGRDALQD
ncbi:MAG: phospholipid carrier-dependent glycosyltransferase [Elainellaceae cyanobacterium]